MILAECKSEIWKAMAKDKEHGTDVQAEPNQSVRAMQLPAQARDALREPASGWSASRLVGS